MRSQSVAQTRPAHSQPSQGIFEVPGGSAVDVKASYQSLPKKQISVINKLANADNYYYQNIQQQKERVSGA